MQTKNNTGSLLPPVPPPRGPGLFLRRAGEVCTRVCVDLGLASMGRGTPAAPRRRLVKRYELGHGDLITGLEDRGGSHTWVVVARASARLVVERLPARLPADITMLVENPAEFYRDQELVAGAVLDPRAHAPVIDRAFADHAIEGADYARSTPLSALMAARFPHGPPACAVVYRPADDSFAIE